MVTALGLIALAAIVAAGVLYNGLVRTRLRVREGWSAIDVQLQRRASLVPNLVDTVKGYAAYERGTMTRIVEARGALGAAVGPGAAAAANEHLNSALRGFFALAEAYPELKANERFAQLQKDLADTENKIAYARNYYNGAVEAYNIKVQSFPTLLLAQPLGFRTAEFFSAEASARNVVDADLTYPPADRTSR